MSHSFRKGNTGMVSRSLFLQACLCRVVQDLKIPAGGGQRWAGDEGIVTPILCSEMRLGLSLRSVAYEGSVRHGSIGVLSLIKLSMHGGHHIFSRMAIAFLVHALSSTLPLHVWGMQGRPLFKRRRCCDRSCSAGLATQSDSSIAFYQ
jgi:hypothetical protein